MNHPHRLARYLLCALFVFVSSATAQVVLTGWFEMVPSRGTEVWGYDSAKGTEENKIRDNFNLHRGRWWNYYERGSWYLTYGHYERAASDFRRVLKKRPVDKWDARTYGMHFIDCFAHRELGIALYQWARQLAVKADKLSPEEEKERLSLLEESIRQLIQSGKDAPSSRAEFFLGLARGEQYKASDTTPPVITVENAASRGSHWAILFCNQRIVPLNIRVADEESGVGAVWVNEKRLVLDRACPIPTVYVPLDANDPWIQIRAKDLVNNNSAPTRVRVVLDPSPPVIFTAADPVPVTPEGLVPIECSVQDNLGLRTIEVGDQKIDCHGSLEYNVAIKIPAVPGRTRVGIRATDLAGGTTEGSVAFLPGHGQTRAPVDPASRLVRFIPLNRASWASGPWPRAVPAFLDSTFSPGLRTLAWNRQVRYFGDQMPRETHGASLSATPVRQVSGLEFSNYRPAPTGHLVTTAQYTVKGTLRDAAGVTGVVIGKTRVGVESHSGMMHFSAIVDLPKLGENRMQVRTLYSDGSSVTYPEPLVFQRVCDPTTESKCLYSVIVLPLVRDGVPIDRHLGSRYLSLCDTVIGCTQCDPNLGEFSRFDCGRVVEHSDPNTLSNDLRRLGVPDTAGSWEKVVELGRGHRTDLGIYGHVMEDKTGCEIKIYIVDIATSIRLRSLRIPSGVVDAYGPNDDRDWLVTQLREKLIEAIPRVRGKVTKIDRRLWRIHVDANRERLFISEKLWIFEEGTALSGSSPCAGLFEATVDSPMEGRSEAKVNRTNADPNLLKGWTADQLYFVTK